MVEYSRNHTIIIIINNRVRKSNAYHLPAPLALFSPISCSCATTRISRRKVELN